MWKKSLLFALPLVLLFVLVAAPVFAKDTQTNGTPFDELWNAVNSLEAKITGYQDTIDGLQANNAALAGEVSSLNSTVVSLQDTVYSFQSAITDLQNSNAALQNTDADLQQQITDLQNELTALESAGSGSGSGSAAPDPTAFTAYFGQSMVIGVHYAQVDYNMVGINDAGAYDATTYTYTAPDTGTYRFYVKLVNGRDDLDVEIFVNGTFELRGDNATYINQPLVHLNAGDKVTVEVSSNDYSTVNMMTYGYFGGFRVY